MKKAPAPHRRRNACSVVPLRLPAEKIRQPLKALYRAPAAKRSGSEKPLPRIRLAPPGGSLDAFCSGHFPSLRLKI